MSQLATVPAGRFEPRQQLTAWETAKARFLENLDDNEKALFESATVENIFYSSSATEKQDARDSKFRTRLEKIQPLVATLNEYGKALDTYTQIEPLYLAPIWGSMRVVMALASAHSRFHGQVVEVLGNIGELLPRLHKYDGLFNASEHPEFGAALSQIYLDIIELCTDIKKKIREQKTSRMKRVFQPLSASVNLQLEDYVVKFKDHQKTVETEAHLCHMIEEKKSRELVLSSKREEEMKIRVYPQKDLVTQLSNLDHKYKHRRMQRLRHPGTGSWVLPTFRNWLDSPSSAILCCSGIPGCGKSVLTSTLIDAAQTISHGSQTQVIFFYCDHADEGTLDPCKIFGNLTQQLLSMISPLPESILNPLDELLRHGGASDFQEVIDLLTEVLKRFTSLVLYMDGVDELSEDNKTMIVQRLWALLRNEDLTVKVYISAREYATRLAKPPEVEIYKFHINQEEINEDIRTFIAHVVHALIGSGQLVIGDPALEDEIARSLIEGSKGMFLWIKFQLADLCASDSDDAIRKTLQNLPADLSETYDRFLIRASKNNLRRRDLLERLFRWVICAKRPLSVDEAREAIAFTIEDDHFVPAKLTNDLYKIVRASGHLIIIDEPTQNVQLAHYTVQQYLLQDQKIERPFFCITIAEANKHVGIACLVYLSFSDFEQQITQYRETGTTPGIAALEKVVKTQSLIPSTTTGSIVAKYLQRTRAGHPSPTGIDFARHIQHITGPSAGSSQFTKFALLPYIIENWLNHTKHLGPEIYDSRRHTTMGTTGSTGYISDREIQRSSQYLHALIFNKKLSFQIWPCEASPLPKSSYPYALQFGHALRVNHAAVAVELSKMAQMVRMELHWERISKWADTFRTSWYIKPKKRHITPDIEQYLNLNYGELAPTGDNWEGWTYRLIIMTAIRGSSDSLQILLKAWNAKVSSILSESTRLFYGHVLMEAVIHSNESLIRYILFGHWDGNESAWMVLTTHYNGLDCNALEIGCLLNLNVIPISIGYPLKITGLDALSFCASLFATNKLEKAIQSKDTPTLMGLLRAIGLKDWDAADKICQVAYFEYTEDRRVEDSILIKFYVTKIRRENELQRMGSPRTMMGLQKWVDSYPDHWISQFEGISFWYAIELVLIFGGTPSDEFGSVLLADIIERSTENIAIDPLETKRLERLIASGVSFKRRNFSLPLTQETSDFATLLYAYGIWELSPIYYAILRGWCHIADVLIRHGALEGDIISDTLSPIHFAIGSQSVLMLETLLGLANSGFLKSIATPKHRAAGGIKRFVEDYCNGEAKQHAMRNVLLTYRKILGSIGINWNYIGNVDARRI